MLLANSRIRVALTRALWTCSLSLLLTACGGGGGGGSSDPGTPPPVIPAPIISSQPASQAVKAGTEITFSPTATGEGTLTYQWQRNGADVPGATDTQYSIVTQEADNGSVWTVKVRNASPNVAISQGATLTVTPAGPGISLLAGDLSESYVGTVFRNGTGSSARFKRIGTLAIDNVGNVYVTDSGTIRKITPNGVTTTLAGTPDEPGSVDGVGSAVRFSQLSGITVDGNGNVWVTDGGSIRKITPAGVVSTLAGVPSIGEWVEGTGSAARFRLPFSPAVDSAGNVYVQDPTYININIRVTAVRKIAPSATTSPFSPGHTDEGYFDGGGALLVDAQDRIHSTGCTYNNINTITQFNAQGAVIQVLPLSQCASLLALDSQGSFYVGFYNQISKRLATGEITPIAGHTSTQPIKLGALPGSIGQVSAMAMGPDGSLYVAAGNAVLQIRVP